MGGDALSRGARHRHAGHPAAGVSLRAVDATTKFLFLFGAIWLAVGTIVSAGFIGAGGPFWNDLILDRRGAQAQATPQRIEPTSSSINDRLVYRIVYTFIDDGGTPRIGSSGTTDDEVLARAERIVWKGLRRVFRVRDIYVHGHAIHAEVTRVAPGNMQVNGRPLMRVDYTFDAITGQVDGHTTMFNPPAVGERIWVLYRPSTPRENVAA